MAAPEFEFAENTCILSPEQKLAVAESRADYQNGNYILNDDANDKIAKWLGE